MLPRLWRRTIVLPRAKRTSLSSVCSGISIEATRYMLLVPPRHNAILGRRSVRPPLLWSISNGRLFTGRWQRRSWTSQFITDRGWQHICWQRFTSLPSINFLGKSIVATQVSSRRLCHPWWRGLPSFWRIKDTFCHFQGQRCVKKVNKLSISYYYVPT